MAESWSKAGQGHAASCSRLHSHLHAHRSLHASIVNMSALHLATWQLLNRTHTPNMKEVKAFAICNEGVILFHAARRGVGCASHESVKVLRTAPALSPRHSGLAAACMAVLESELHHRQCVTGLLPGWAWAAGHGPLTGRHTDRRRSSRRE